MEPSENISFWKMSGAGNDFIIIDNRDGVMDRRDLPHFVQKVCRRQLSAGADGLILIENDPEADFRWRFFNSDGGRAEMCGNGARCAARFAHLNGVAGREMTFTTDAGTIAAEVIGSGAKVKMTAPSSLESALELDLREGETLTCSFINTGVPHAVIPADDIGAVDVVGLGRQVRYHRRFDPAGTNANFIQLMTDGAVAIRTYERGVEDETLACGTGAVAGAIVASRLYSLKSPVRMRTRSGAELVIHFGGAAEGFNPVFMEGDARIVYTGRLASEAWEY
jgi:diaminopimelate epimerase